MTKTNILNPLPRFNPKKFDFNETPILLNYTIIYVSEYRTDNNYSSIKSNSITIFIDYTIISQSKLEYIMDLFNGPIYNLTLKMFDINLNSNFLYNLLNPKRIIIDRNYQYLIYKIEYTSSIKIPEEFDIFNNKDHLNSFKLSCI